MMNLQNSSHRRNHCTACTFILHGVKTRKNIPHTCGKTNVEIMRIIKKGSIKKDLPVQKTCHKCGCVFEYHQPDIQSDRDGLYVICPTEECKSFISV